MISGFSRDASEIFDFLVVHAALEISCLPTFRELWSYLYSFERSANIISVTIEHMILGPVGVPETLIPN
jgi:hypothetical protein